MKILVFSEGFLSNYYPLGGSFIFDQVQALSKYVHVSVIVPLRFIPPKEIFLKRNILEIIREFKKWFRLITSQQDIREKNFEVIYFKYISLIRTNHELLNQYFIFFLLFNKVIRLFKNHPPDLIYQNWFTPGGVICKKLSDYFNVPLVLDSHSTLKSIKSSNKNFNRLKKYFNNYSLLIVHSNLVENEFRNELKSHHLQIPYIEKIYLGQNFKLYQRNNTIKEPVKLVTVSHLVDRFKNVDGLIKSLLILKNRHISFSLDIIGDGIDKKRLIEFVKECGMNDQINFLGKKNREEINLLLEKYDIFVFPSLRESFGIVVIEAIMKGLPVIAFKEIGASSELDALGSCIFHPESNSVQDLANAILKLLEDQTKREMLVQVGQKIVSENFSWDSNAIKTYNILNKLIKKNENS